MKRLLILSTCLAAFTAPAFADGTKTLGGCELTDKGGYSVKADASCVYAWDGNIDGQDVDLGDYDNDSSTPPTRG